MNGVLEWPQGLFKKLELLTDFPIDFRNMTLYAE